MKIRSVSRHFAIAGAMTLGLAACASAYTGGGEAGVLTDTRGMTVYVFDKDTANSGTSVCAGPCAAKWPPVPADAISGAGVGAIDRADGMRQATRGGRPLYYFAGDQAAGERKGDGLGGVWHVVSGTARPASKGGYGGGGY